VTTVGPETQNPYDPSRTPGGSSSGSAAAVADMQVPFAIGTQTSGSIIRPASFCGVFGMKPTWNAISGEGQKLYSTTVDTFGFFSRSLEDLQLLANVFALEGDDQITELQVKECKVGILKTFVWPKAGPGTVEAMKLAAKILRDEGVSVEEISLPAEFDDLGIYHNIIIDKDAQSTFLREHYINKELLDPKIVAWVENRGNISRKRQLEAFDKVAALRPIFDSIAAQYNAIITPSVVDEAPVGISYTGNAVFNAIWTASIL
jgi:amidase